ncbi:MAG TPA: hypothetical protein PKD10_04885 [Paracoccaceae bacterium]|nr:hypothetical protein [Paracoccaceae bacterium]HMO71301.1 hypothetical protein [Paracoccaceae bacterium]
MPASRDLRKKHVRSAVKTIPLTDRIIEDILPHLEGTDIEIVSGYLNDTDQFWKVNHHYDALQWIIEKCLKVETDDEVKRSLGAIQKALNRSRPSPPTGYRTGAIGKPEDKSTPKEIVARWTILRQAKKDWIGVYEDTAAWKAGKPKVSAFKHPSSPIKKPGTSMHGTGYAIDMVGNSSQIAAISRYLGATLIYNEPGNFHIEFKNGVANKPVKPKGK